MSEFADLVGHPETRLGEMIEATPSCLKVLDKNGCLLTMNAKGLSMIEAPSMQAVEGADVFALVAPQDREAFIEFHHRVCAGNSGRLIFKLIGLNGTERLMETWASPYRLTNGETSHIAITNDITEREKTEEIMQVQRKALELASRHAAMGELAAGIAHEINNPLGVIAGFAGMMKAKLEQSDHDPESFHANLAKIEETVARISEITESLCTFSRNVPIENRELCNVRIAVDETFALVKEKAKAAGIDIRNVVPEELYIDANRVGFSQVLMNLLTNSLHAIQDERETWVEVTANKVGEAVHIEFKDSGRGIDPSHIDKIMTPFYSTKSLGEGTGLGLPISLGIIRSLGGTLQYVEDAPHTTFRIELPLSSSSAARP